MTIVRFEVVVWRIVSRVEIEHLDVLIVLTSEQMSSIWEYYFATILDVQVFVLLDWVFKDVHHTDFVEEANYNLETGRMKGYTAGIVLEDLIDFQFEFRVVIFPDFNSLIAWACRYQVLLDTDIHSIDRSRMEGMYEILIDSFDVFVV